jgi:hypothetical protein
MLRRMLQILMPVAAVALVLAGATPAAAAGFTGTATITSPGWVTAGTTVTFDIVDTGLSPQPTTYTVQWRTQPVGGGAITNLGAPVSGPVTDLPLTYPTTASEVGDYLLPVVVLSDGTNTYQLDGQTEVRAATFSTVPDALTVSGTPRVGQTLTVTTTSTDWSPTPDSVQYVWHDADTNAVLGTGADHTLTAGDLGRTVYVQASAERSGFTTSDVASAFIGAVGPAEFTLEAAPQVPSAARTGSPLTVAAPTLTPTPDSIAYQWYRTPDVQIPGATGATYTPTAADLGAQLYVVAIASRASTSSYQVGSNLTGTVALQSFGTTPVPTLTGTGIIGTAFTADPHASGWAPTVDTFSYRWFRASAGNPAGTVIDGATTSTYTATQADVDSYVYVEVTAHAADVHDYVIGSAPSATVHLPWIASGTGDGSITAPTGGTFQVSLHGLLPFTSYALELHSTPVSLGTVTTGADGTATVTLTLPAGVSSGSHHLVVLLGGSPVLTMPVTVTAAGAELASTGAAPGGLLLLAGALMALGVLLLRVPRLSRR